MGRLNRAFARLALPAALALAFAPGIALAQDGAQAHGGHAPGHVAESQRSEDDRLEELLLRQAIELIRLDPMGFVMLGASSGPEEFSDTFSDAKWLRTAQLTQSGRTALARIDRAKLTERARLEYDVLAFDLARETAWQRTDIAPLARVLPLDHFDGLQLFYPSIASGDGSARFETVADYEAMLVRHRLLPQVFDRAIARYREGRAAGLVMGAPAVRAMIDQIDDVLALPAVRSPFAQPLRNFPANFDEATRRDLEARYLAAIREDVLPAYARLRAFLAEEYLPGTREGSGLAGTENGARLYRALIARHTTLALDPDALHRLGVGEVARIGGEMEATGRQLGLTGSLGEMLAQSRVDPRFRPASQQALEARFDAVAQAVEAQLPRFFHTPPERGPEIRPYPLWAEATSPGGGYAPPGEDKPATFFYNAYRIDSRSFAAAASLYLHEAMPGHHLETVASFKAPEISPYRRQARYTAYSEGWALYAETLGYEMGIYDDPLNRWGTLEEEMLRAMRLVVDTGLHHLGWSRGRAIRYMLDHSSISEAEAEREVDRYIASPAQALAYKVGAMTIQRLRDEAEAALGARFDLRDFHAAVLGAGPLPLPILERRVRGWIAAERDRMAAKPSADRARN